MAYISTASDPQMWKVKKKRNRKGGEDIRKEKYG